MSLSATHVHAADAESRTVANFKISVAKSK
jgi:hypothetical protein